MPTGTGRGRGRGRSQEGSSSKSGDGGYNNDERIKVGVAWINGQKADGYLDDMLEDSVYLRFSLDEHPEIPEGWNIFGFPNKNKQGKAPDIDFVALPPRDKS
ncbi:hypothetical protein LCGC14_2735300 [marine sediment metagenome]|uniref:Uncharacterized protein n=1 Tax=marine sediment metagenome TaxID=412755 RepID=A0A0F8ZTB2_9ZZZZ